MILRPLPDGTPAATGTIYRLVPRATDANVVGTLELELRATSGGARASGGDASASSVLAGSPQLAAGEAFDGDYTGSNGWAANTNGGNGSEWLQYRHTSDLTAVQYAVGAYPGATLARSPVAWLLKRSTDGSAWATVDVRGNQTSWTANSSRVFTVDQSDTGQALYEDYSPTTALTGSSYTVFSMVVAARFAASWLGFRMKTNASGSHTVNVRSGGVSGTIVATGSASGTGDLTVMLNSPLSVTAAASYFIELVTPVAAKVSWSSGGTYEGWFWSAGGTSYFAGNPATGTLPLRVLVAR